MPDHTQEKLHDQTAASMDFLLHAKVNFLPQINLEILKLSDLIGREQFQLQLKN